MEGGRPKKMAKLTVQKQDAIDGNSSIVHNHHLPQNETQEEIEDRISILPDTILVTILSILPIHSAAATSVLSRCWRHVWTHITHLHFRFSSCQHIATIDHIISQLKSSKLHTFDLPLLLDPPSKVSSEFLVPWIRHICRRSPEVFKLILCVYPLHEKFSKIPCCLFQTQSLVQLQLDAKIEFNFDETCSFAFPNLKKLDLAISPHKSLIGKSGPLFKSCPLLEDLNLNLDFTKDDHLVDISAPNLKCLRMRVTIGDLEDCKVVIDTPKLENLKFDGDLIFYDFITIPSNLQQVDMSISEESFGHHDNCVSKIPGLTRGISYVRSLVLQSECGILLLDYISDLNSLPIFHNLIYISLFYRFEYWICKLPECFSLGNLKRVDIQGVACEKVELKLIKHILSNVLVLEKLHFFVYCDLKNDDQAKMEYKFCKQLFMHPKSSVNCEIEFYGLEINASSKDFRGGVLIYQVLDHQHWDDTEDTDDDTD